MTPHRSIRTHRLTLGGLACRVVDALPEESSPHLAVVLCHGFGAPGEDLVPMGSELLQFSPALAARVRFFFPAAPLSLGAFGPYESRAWWVIDPEALQAAIARGEFRQRCKEIPAELPEMRGRLTRLVEEIESTTGLPTSRIVVGGFSQGAMLATDTALHLAESPAALCIFSGTLISEGEWRRLAPNRRGLRVLQSHGSEDPLLPYAGAEWLRDLLREAGLEVEFVGFRGAHTIPFDVMERFARLLEDLTGGRRE